MLTEASQGLLMHADDCTLTTPPQDPSPVWPDLILLVDNGEWVKWEEKNGEKNQLPSDSLRGCRYTLSNDSEPKASLFVSDGSFVLHFCNLICLSETLSQVIGCRCVVQQSVKRES